MRAAILATSLGLAAMLPMPAAADGDWILGVYGDEAGCAVHNGGTPATDNLIVVQVDEIRRLEAVCPIADVAQQSNQIVLDVQCTGEGETFATQYLVEDGQGDSFVISIPGTGYQATIEPCN